MFCPVPRAAARLRYAPAGLALGYYHAAPPGQESAALRAVRRDLGAASGCARARLFPPFNLDLNGWAGATLSGVMVSGRLKTLDTCLCRPLLAFAVGLALAACSPHRTEAAPQSQRAAGTQPTRAERTALDEYVAAPDTNYSFRLIESVPGRQETTFILEMTSQAWLTTNEVNRALWKHWLVIIRPNEVAASKSLLFIGGGANDGSPPKPADGSLVQIALATKSVVSELRMVPNQPLVFSGESLERSEDSLIAYTWDKFLRTGDPKWPARLPMTKAAVRAMDTVTAFAASPDGGKLNIDGFVVAGGSKRGWTTWTTAAVDKRVVAIVPIVINVLNLEAFDDASLRRLRLLGAFD